MDKELTDAQWMFVYNSMLWIKGALFQGNRLLSASEQSNNFNLKISENHQDFYTFHKESMELQEICRYEEDFFTLSLYNSIFFLSKAANTLTGFREFYDEIENVNGNGQIKDVRDMRVHVDEYLKGKGGKNKDNARFIYESREEQFPVAPSAQHLFAADATSTIVIDGEYLIGGRINVNKTLAALEKLLPDIVKLCRKYLFPSTNSM